MSEENKPEEKKEITLRQAFNQLSFDIQKNIEANCEQTEEKLFEKMDEIDDKLAKILKLIEGEENNENEEESSDENGTSIADKFAIPEEKEELTSEAMSNMETNILDTNLKVEALENTVRNMYRKINELIKVNNAILKKMENNSSKNVEKNDKTNIKTKKVL